MNLVCFVMYSFMKIDIYKAVSKYYVETSSKISEKTSEKSLKTYECVSIACLKNEQKKKRTKKTRQEVITSRKTSQSPQHEPTRKVSNDPRHSMMSPVEQCITA